MTEEPLYHIVSFQQATQNEYRLSHGNIAETIQLSQHFFHLELCWNINEFSWCPNTGVFTVFYSNNHGMSIFPPFSNSVIKMIADLKIGIQIACGVNFDNSFGVGSRLMSLMELLRTGAETKAILEEAYPSDLGIVHEYNLTNF